MHVEQVLGTVPKNERCKCRETAKTGAPEEQTPSLKDSIWSFWR